MKIFLPQTFSIKISQKKSYSSPFEKVDFQKILQLQPCSLTLHEVVQKLDIALHLDNHKERDTILALYPSRILRGMIAFREQFPMEFTFETYALAVRACLEVFAQSKDALVLWKQLLANDHFQDMLSLQVEQKLDIVGWESTKPNRSKQTAERLFLQLGGAPIVFLPLACGAIDAGMDVYLNYMQLASDKNSIFYPIKYSKYKSGDTSLVLTHNEKIMLSKQMGRQKKTIVLFDENILSGGTTKAAKEALQQSVFAGREIVIETNLNITHELPFLFSPIQNSILYSHEALDQLALDYFNKQNHYF